MSARTHVRIIHARASRAREKRVFCVFDLQSEERRCAHPLMMPMRCARRDLAAGDVVRICFTRMCKCDVAFAVVVEQPPPPVRPIMHTPSHTVALALAVIMYHKLDSHLAAGCQREVDARARQPRALMLSVFRACVCVCVFRKIEYNAWHVIRRRTRPTRLEASAQLKPLEARVLHMHGRHNFAAHIGFNCAQTAKTTTQRTR